MFGKAMGAEVTAISHSPKKQEDAKKVYWLYLVGVSDVSSLGRRNSSIPARKILQRNMPWNSISLSAPQMQVKRISLKTIIYRILPLRPAGETSLTLSMLNINGTFNQCGLPNEDLPPVASFTFAEVLLPCLPDLTLEW